METKKVIPTSRELEYLTGIQLVTMTSTEELIPFLMHAQNAELKGEAKMYWNKMLKCSKAFKYYLERYLDNASESLAKEDKDFGRIDLMRYKGYEFLRLLCWATNMEANQYPIDNICASLKATIQKEDSPEYPIREEIINQFKLLA